MIKHNSKQTVKMAALQSPEGEKIIAEHEIPEGYLDSLVLVRNGKVYTHSSAALELCKELDGAWKLFWVFWFIPKFIRDWIYQWIAKNRYRWYGKMEACMIPKPEHKNWFL